MRSFLNRTGTSRRRRDAPGLGEVRYRTISIWFNVPRVSCIVEDVYYARATIPSAVAYSRYTITVYNFCIYIYVYIFTQYIHVYIVYVYMWVYPMRMLYSAIWMRIARANIKIRISVTHSAQPTYSMYTWKYYFVRFQNAEGIKAAVYWFAEPNVGHLLAQWARTYDERVEVWYANGSKMANPPRAGRAGPVYPGIHPAIGWVDQPRDFWARTFVARSMELVSCVLVGHWVVRCTPSVRFARREAGRRRWDFACFNQLVFMESKFWWRILHSETWSWAGESRFCSDRTFRWLEISSEDSIRDVDRSVVELPLKPNTTFTIVKVCVRSCLRTSQWWLHCMSMYILLL